MLRYSPFQWLICFAAALADWQLCKPFLINTQRSIGFAATAFCWSQLLLGFKIRFGLRPSPIIYDAGYTETVSFSPQFGTIAFYYFHHYYYWAHHHDISQLTIHNNIYRRSLKLTDFPLQSENHICNSSRMMSLFHLLLAVASLAISVSSFQSSGLPTTSSLVNTLHTHNNKNNNNKLSSVTFLNNPQPIIAAGMQQQFSTSNLFSTTTTDDDAASSSSANNDNEETSKLDVDAIVKYTGALATQMVLFTGLFVGLDKLVTTTGIQVPFALNFIFFYFCALKSRILNPLQNSRPQVSNKEIEIAPERKMPQWTPPGFIFPVVWLLLIGPLRAATTSMVYSAAGSYCNKAILSLMLHLSIGDIWNTSKFVRC